MRTFIHESHLSASPERAFAFHERPDILALLIPPWQRVEVVSRTGGLNAGARVEFRMRLGPVTIPWVAVHTAWERNRLFIDEQETGPFAYWRHQHLFLPANGGCRLRDEIHYALPLGLNPVLGWLIDRALRRMFVYRHEVTARSLATP